METLKRQKMQCGIDEVPKLVKDSLEENISRESFDKTLQLLTDNNSVKPNSVSNRVCLNIPENNTCRDAFTIKEEHQSFKNELFEEFYPYHTSIFCGNKLVEKRRTNNRCTYRYEFILHQLFQRRNRVPQRRKLGKNNN